MELQSHRIAHQFLATPALAGTWKLEGRRAVTLRPGEPGVLRVAHGRLWATFDGPHDVPRRTAGDFVLGAGAALPVQAGQRVVVEAWGAREASYFSWDPLPRAQLAASPGLAAVAQSLADLRLALVFGAGAGWRLVRGLAAVALAPLARRGAVRATPACVHGAG